MWMMMERSSTSHNGSRSPRSRGHCLHKKIKREDYAREFQELRERRSRGHATKTNPFAKAASDKEFYEKPHQEQVELVMMSMANKPGEDGNRPRGKDEGCRRHGKGEVPLDVPDAAKKQHVANLKPKNGEKPCQLNIK